MRRSSSTAQTLPSGTARRAGGRHAPHSKCTSLIGWLACQPINSSSCLVAVVCSRIC
jgi:hypothetical protein